MLDYKRQRGGGADAGSRGKGGGVYAGYLQKGKGRVKSSTRKSDPQNEGKGERAGR